MIWGWTLATTLKRVIRMNLFTAFKYRRPIGESLTRNLYSLKKGVKFPSTKKQCDREWGRREGYEAKNRASKEILIFMCVRAEYEFINCRFGLLWFVFAVTVNSSSHNKHFRFICSRLHAKKWAVNPTRIRFHDRINKKGREPSRTQMNDTFWFFTARKCSAW